MAGLSSRPSSIVTHGCAYAPRALPPVAVIVAPCSKPKVSPISSRRSVPVPKNCPRKPHVHPINEWDLIGLVSVR